MKNKNIAITIFVFSLLLAPAVAFGVSDPPPEEPTPPPTSMPLPPPDPLCAVVQCDGSLLVAHCPLQESDCPTDPGPGPVCTPTAESCGACTAQQGVDEDEENGFTQTCTNGCSSYQKACTTSPAPPPVCTPLPGCVPVRAGNGGAITGYPGTCSVTCGGGTRTVTDSCGSPLRTEACNISPCNNPGLRPPTDAVHQ